MVSRLEWFHYMTFKYTLGILTYILYIFCGYVLPASFSVLAIPDHCCTVLPCHSPQLTTKSCKAEYIYISICIYNTCFSSQIFISVYPCVYTHHIFMLWQSNTLYYVCTCIYTCMYMYSMYVHMYAHVFFNIVNICIVIVTWCKYLL